MNPLRHIRFQGAIVDDGQVLLIRHQEHVSGRSYWLFPGGGIEPNESDVECVTREMHEETGLEVRIDGLVFDEPYAQPGAYIRRRLYLCTPLAGEAAPGYEPEPDAAAHYGIVEVGWFPIDDPAGWGPAGDDPYTAPELKLLRAFMDERRRR